MSSPESRGIFLPTQSSSQEGRSLSPSGRAEILLWARLGAGDGLSCQGPKEMSLSFHLIGLLLPLQFDSRGAAPSPPPCGHGQKQKNRPGFTEEDLGLRLRQVHGGAGAGGGRGGHPMASGRALPSTCLTPAPGSPASCRASERPNPCCAMGVTPCEIPAQKGSPLLFFSSAK